MNSKRKRKETFKEQVKRIIEENRETLEALAKL